MNHVLWRAAILRIVLIASGLLTVPNCDIFKEKITIEPSTAFSRLNFLDSSTIVYLKTTWDTRWSDGPFGGNRYSSVENFRYTLETQNIYSGAKDTLLTFPGTQSRVETELSFYPPILLLSPVGLQAQKSFTYYYNIASKASGSYANDNRLVMADSSSIAYDYRGNVFNATTGDKLFSLTSSKDGVDYYCTRKQAVIFHTDTLDSLNRFSSQYQFGTFDPVTGLIQAQKINRSMRDFEKNIDRSRYILFVTNESYGLPTRIEIIPTDSLDVAFTKSRLLTLDLLWGIMVCDAVVDRELLLLRGDRDDFKVINFSGEIVAGPLTL